MAQRKLQMLDKPAFVFDELNVRPVINCSGIYTDLGGSVLSPEIWHSLSELNSTYVRMTDLMDQSGRLVAAMVGSEAARITPGASAAIALAVGATMTGTHGDRWEQLPDTTGLKSEFVIATHHLAQYKYAVCARMTGGKFVPAGPPDAFYLDSLKTAISEQTACVFAPVHLLDGGSNINIVAQLADIAHSAGVPLVLDAAYMVYPTRLLRQYHEAGADLVCVSAKYFSGPNSGGFVAGRKHLIAAVEGLDFTRFESGKYRGFGRAFKMSRYDVAATTLALRDWLEMDHEKRWQGYAEKVRAICRTLPAIPNVNVSQRLFTMSEELLESEQVNCVVFDFSKTSTFSAQEVARTLEMGNPIIAAIPAGDLLIVAVDALLDGQEHEVGSRLARALQ